MVDGRDIDAVSAAMRLEEEGVVHLPAGEVAFVSAVVWGGIVTVLGTGFSIVRLARTIIRRRSGSRGFSW